MDGHQTLEELGWLEVRDIYDNQGLVHLAQSLGSVEPRVVNLSPTPSAQAKHKSFSYYYGLGQFPMHTDTAFWPIPARYIVLRSAGANDTPTLLLPFPKLQTLLNSCRVDTAIFGIRTHLGSRYGKAVFSQHPFGVRFDPCYMKGATEAAKELMGRLSFPDPGLIDRFKWSGTNALIIDNWKCLHARAPLATNGLGRKLFRVYVSETER
jgi:alpha-ketoglutarate-dependent taurine dioxygenase